MGSAEVRTARSMLGAMEETQRVGRYGNAGKLVRIMLVDDHEIVRGGVRGMLEGNADLRVVAEAATVRESIVEADRVHPEVVILDVRLADGSGIEATREIRAQHPDIRVLILTSFADDEALFAAIMAGASGYVLEQIRGRGQSLLDPAVTATVLTRLRKGKHLMQDEKLSKLSATEERVLRLVAEGLTNKEIGERLRLAEKTVKNYVSTILSKLEVTRRAEAASYLARRVSTPGSF